MRIAIDLTSPANNFSGIERRGAELSRALLGIDGKIANLYLLAEEFVDFLDERLYWLTSWEGPLDSTSNGDSIRMARNKSRSLAENLFARRLNREVDFEIEAMYAGTRVLSALQLCLELELSQSYEAKV